MEEEELYLFFLFLFEATNKTYHNLQQNISTLGKIDKKQQTSDKLLMKNNNQP